MVRVEGLLLVTMKFRQPKRKSSSVSRKLCFFSSRYLCLQSAEPRCYVGCLTQTVDKALILDKVKINNPFVYSGTFSYRRIVKKSRRDFLTGKKAFYTITFSLKKNISRFSEAGA